MREMRNSGVDWIGEIPATWEIVPLKSLFSFGKGLPITKDNLEETGVPVISYGQIHAKWNSGVTVHRELLRFVNESYLDTNPQSLVHRGDLIMADTSEDREGCGNCVYVDTDELLFAGYHTIILRSLSKTDNKYLAYLFLTDPWRSQIRKAVSGVKLFSVSRRILGSVSVIVPDNADEIVAHLDKKCTQVNSLITNVQAQIEKLKTYRMSIVIEAVTKGLAKDVPMMHSGVDWIGEIPTTWSTIRVKQLLRERKERSLEGKEEPLSMSQKVGLVPTKMLDSIPNMASSFVGAKLTYVNDLVFNKLKAHLGVFSVSKYDGLVSPDYAVYYSTGVADLKYLEYLFKTPQCISEFRKRSTGIAAGLTRLYTDGLFAIECPLPPKDEQQEIVAYLDEKWAQIDRLIAIKQAKIEKLEQYKRSLIYEYVTGKREVS